MKNKPLPVYDIKLWQRLLLVGLTGTVPLFIVALILIKSTYSDSINFALQEQRGIVFQRPLEQLLDLLPRYEAATRQASTSEAMAGDSAGDLRQQIDRAMDTLASNYNGDLGKALAFTDTELSARQRSNARLSVLQTNWNNFKQGSLSDLKHSKALTNMVGSVRTMIAHSGDLSNLILDDELDSYYLADITVTVLPQTQKRLGDVTLQVGSRLRKGEMEPGKTKAAVMSELLRQDDINRIQRDAQTSLREDKYYYGISQSLQNNLPPAVEKFSAASSNIVEVLDRIAAGDGVTPAELEAAGWNAHAECLRLWQTCADELDRLLVIRIHAIETRRLQCYLIIVGTLALVALVMGFIIRNLLTAHHAEALQAAEELRSREAQLRAIGDNLPDGMVFRIMRDFDGAMRFLYVSAGIERLNGLAAEAVLRDSNLFHDQVLPEDRPKLAIAWQNSLLNLSVFKATVRMHRADGNVRWMQITSSPWRKPDGRFVWDGITTDVTEQRRAVESLTLLRSLIDRTNDSIEILDPETGRYLDVNEQASRVHGYSQEEYKTLVISDIDAKTTTSGPQAWSTLLAKLQQAGYLVFESRHRRKDGSTFPVEINATYIRLERDYVLAVVRDITERKRAEQRIRHLNRVYAVLSDINQTIVRERDLPAMLQAACQIAVEKGEFRMAWIGMLDEASQQIKPVASAGIVDGYLASLNINFPDRPPPSGPATQVLLSGEHAICNDIEHDAAYGPWREDAIQRGYRSSGGFPLKVEGRVVGIFNLYADEPDFFNSDELKLLDELAMDIGFALEFNRQEAWRKQSEERFSRIFNTSPLPISLTRFSDGAVLDVNESFLRMSGFTREEVIGNTISDLGVFADPEARLFMRAQLQQHGHLHGFEQVFRTKTGQTRDRILWSVIITIEGEKCALTIALDVTEQKLAEQERKQSEERFSRMFNSSPLPIFLTRFEDGQMVDVNESFLSMSGFTREELIGRTSLELEFYGGQNERKHIVEYLRKYGHLHAHEQKFRTKSGQIRNHVLWMDAITIGGEKHILVLALDVTEQKQTEQKQKQLEEQLRQAQKLEALGTLAGGIAHDFNNILGAIISFSELTRMDNPDNTELQENLGEVLKASNRATNLVRQILSFSRRQKHERKNLQLAGVIQEALKLLRATLPATIDIQHSIDDELPDVLANPTQIHQVVMNLCTNSAHAMKDRQGQLQVKLSRLYLNDADPRPQPELVAGDYVRLTVSDTGSGMDETTLKRIFEPFFTTKGPGEGTGLGLSVVHGIVKEHEGVIGVESEPGRGTAFTIYLPGRAAAAAPELLDDLEIPQGNGERVLFVDDEIMLGEVAQKIIRRLGYHPVVFHDAGDAWAAIQKDPAAYDVLISDLTMPVMTGMDLARLALQLRPNLPIILTSGSSGTFSRAEVHEIGIRELMSKPLDYQTLAAVLNKVLRPAPKLK